MVNGNISFIVGTRFGGIVNRDPKEVPLSHILNNVSQAELRRFENQDFLEEDVREAIQPPPKSKGRPKGSRLIDGRLVPAGASTGPSRTQKPQTQGSRPVVVIPSSSRALQRSVTLAPSSAISHLSVKVLAPSGSQQVAVQVPSFNGPQPGQLKHVGETDASSESSEDELSAQWPKRRPQYAMMAASGLAPLDSSLEEDTSREVSMSRKPSHEATLSYDHEQSPKRRRLDTQLPLRATGPIMKRDGRNTTSKSYPGQETFFDSLFKQSKSLTSLTESDHINHDSFKEHVNGLPPMWPKGSPITFAAQDDAFPPPDSSFPPGFDRGRYPAQRRRRRRKFYTPERTPLSVAGTMSKPSIHADQVPQKRSPQSEVEDVDMVDMLEIRDEEAEREALLWQFQPRNNPQSRQHSSSIMTPEPVISTPPCNTVPGPALPPLLPDKAILLARNILNQIKGQSHHAQPHPGPSIQVTTPEKSIQKRASLTPHYPPGVMFAPHTLSATPGHQAHQAHQTGSDHSPSKAELPPSSKALSFAIEGKGSPNTATSSKAWLSGSHSNSPISRATTKTPVFNASKSPRQDNNRFTIPIKAHSNHRTKPPPPTNGTSSKHRLETPILKNDITKYFRPKFSPSKPPLPPSSEDDETESEDQLTRPSSHKTLNPTTPLVQSRSHPSPAPAQAQSHNNNNSMPPQRLTQRTPPLHALDDESTDEARDMEIADSEPASPEISDTDTDDDDDAEERMQRSEQLSHSSTNNWFAGRTGGGGDQL